MFLDIKLINIQFWVVFYSEGSYYTPANRVYLWVWGERGRGMGSKSMYILFSRLSILCVRLSICYILVSAFNLAKKFN